MTKTCTKCGEYKALSGYHKKSSHKDGLSPWCKLCTSLVNREYNNRPEIKLKLKKKQQDLKWKKYNNYMNKERHIRDPRLKLIAHAKERAKKQNIDFAITKDDIEIPDKCPILGIPIYVGEKRFHDGSPTIDRINNNKGYIKNNIRVISWRANSIKRDASIEEIDKIIIYMKNNLGGKHEQSL